MYYIYRVPTSLPKEQADTSSGSRRELASSRHELPEASTTLDPVQWLPPGTLSRAYMLQRQQPLLQRSFCVSTCTFVPVNTYIEWGVYVAATAALVAAQLLCQYSYLCTSNASTLN
jgi:hypothetical protein